RLPVSEELAVDFRGEAGGHVAGPRHSLQRPRSGLSRLPPGDFRAPPPHQLRHADRPRPTPTPAPGGKPGRAGPPPAPPAPSDASQLGKGTTVVDFLGGVAVRPLKRDDFGLLFSWKRSDRRQSGLGPGDQVRALSDTLSTDGVFEFTPRVRYFGRVALTLTA